ncbi:glycosyltransferase family 2 protein [Skermanella pratensis]|uniref:glycosyltransferase family 2 protein n=1 Tax=Skermanella pratensis TaxID=2233999 RepID=UPI00178797DA|nr:glycosyltransferase family 2 protein [Skermanella pratensis]
MVTIVAPAAARSAAVFPMAEPRLSVVVPVYNEAGNVLPLLVEIRAALSAFVDYEVIFVDDGSDDGTAGRLAEERGDVRVVRHSARSGQSAAVRTGVRAARGTWIATLDGDGQNDPADIPNLLDRAMMPDVPTLVGGLRRERRDVWSKRVATRIANGLRQAVLDDGCADTGCGIKVFRRDAFLDLPYFGAMHRFLPALFQIHGHRVAFVDVNHRPRRCGMSKYGNLARATIGIVDLMGVLWLKRRTRLPDSVLEDCAGQVR